MTRKDTILVAVVINAGLLALLFAAAVIYDTGSSAGQIELAVPLEELKPAVQEPPLNLIAAASTGDEVDNVLKFYSTPLQQPIVVSTNTEETYVIKGQEPEQENLPPAGVSESEQEKFVEIKVKQGDMLEKIARAHKTTVSAIKKANNLDSEWLSIGQVLKIPVKAIGANAANAASESQKGVQQEASSAEKVEQDPVYYVLKSGDNPWKIAKQHGVKYDEILRLNQMSEEKARNLKIGDRIRVK